MAPSHLVTHAELALHSDVHFHHLDHTRGQLITSPELGDLFIAYRLQCTNLFPCCAFDVVHTHTHASRLCHRQVEKPFASNIGQNLLGETLAFMDDNRTGTLSLDVRRSNLP